MHVYCGTGSLVSASITVFVRTNVTPFTPVNLDLCSVYIQTRQKSQEIVLTTRRIECQKHFLHSQP